MFQSIDEEIIDVDERIMTLRCEWMRSDKETNVCGEWKSKMFNSIDVARQWATVIKATIQSMGLSKRRLRRVYVFL